MSFGVRRALHVAGVLLFAVLLVVAFGYAMLVLTFGSADHTQFTLTAEDVPRDHIAERATADLSAREAAVVDEASRTEAPGPSPSDSTSTVRTSSVTGPTTR